MWMSYYLPLTPGFFSILVGFSVIVLILRSVRYAYESLGVNSDTAIFLLFATLIGSIFNIPNHGTAAGTSHVPSCRRFLRHTLYGAGR